MKYNRRNFIRNTASVAAAMSVTGLTGCAGSGKKENREKSSGDVKWPVIEGPHTPKLCVGAGINSDEKQMQFIKQMGVDYVLMGGPRIPWKAEELRAVMDRYTANGLTVINMMIGGHNNAIYGREGRDEEIAKIKESIVAAGAAGLPVIEYNWYIDRLMEGYYEKKGRGDSGITAYDYAPVKDLPAKPEIGTFTAEQVWDNITYFLKEVIPVAEKAGVRLALHPNDPPAPISHGSPQIMATYEGWKRLLDIVKSPANGMTYDPGVCREMGLDPVEVLRYMGSRDQINHAHYRNVTTQEAYNKYEEVFFDVGEVNLFAVMHEFFKVGYTRGIYPEHPRFFTRDTEFPGYVAGRGYPGGGSNTGQVYNVAYARAMMQAVQSL
ncbi:MAG: mannonate dehydratase [Bacteroidales bacterium]|nr:mannonate dehydratase [Bacteroidales bacterium]